MQSDQDSHVLQLRHLPLRSVTSIYEDENGFFGFGTGAFPASTLLVSGTDYYPILNSASYGPTGQVVRRTGAWATELGSIKIAYTAGYTAAEFNEAVADISGNAIKQAIEITAVRAYKQLKAHQKNARAGFTAGPITEEKLGEYWYKTDHHILENLVKFTVKVPSEAARLLSRYKSYGELIS